MLFGANSKLNVTFVKAKKISKHELGNKTNIMYIENKIDPICLLDTKLILFHLRCIRVNIGDSISMLSQSQQRDMFKPNEEQSYHVYWLYCNAPFSYSDSHDNSLLY